ncbi:MAG: hypothetical protein EA406_05955 [Rhodospirillales bacterium]|nr:MAG: hypothetical protein EA406_05955 [Rhodospirillales bacterium]
MWLAAFVSAVMPVPLSAAEYLSSFGRFGAWTVICAADTAGSPPSCAIEAPPRDFGDPAALLEIRSGADGMLEIAVDRFGDVAWTAPVYLRIDADQPFRAQANAAGDVLWQGSEAEVIIAALSRGRTLVIRAFTGDGSRPTDAEIPLTGFAEAYRMFRDGGVER